MEYKRYDNDIVLRLDKSDEILSSIAKIAETEDVKAASFTGIGASDDIDVGIFSIEKSTYEKFHYEGNHEITSLTGNITTADNKPYIHAHITCADKDGKIVGGHLLKGNISLTCEIFIHILDCRVKRKYDPQTNINKFDF